jgi:hypothetical protein
MNALIYLEWPQLKLVVYGVSEMVIFIISLCID